MAFQYFSFNVNHAPRGDNVKFVDKISMQMFSDVWVKGDFYHWFLSQVCVTQLGMHEGLVKPQLSIQFFFHFFGYKMLFPIKPLKAVDFGRWGGTANNQVIHCFVDFTRHKLTNEIIVWHESWQLLNHYRINLLCRIPFEINQSCFRHARINTLIEYV